MSLVGTLEELGLGEILQIVSLSRKTGVLFLSSSGRDGSVFFRQGQVVRATSSAHQQSLGEVLIQKGVIDPDVLQAALAYQQEHGFCELLGVILVKQFAISQEDVTDVVREQIEKIVFSLFSWSEGTFRFVVQDSLEPVDGTKMDPLQFMLDQGLNPQFLAMEGTRILDDQRRTAEIILPDTDASQSSIDFDFNLAVVVDNLSSPRQVTAQPIVIVDDDGPTLTTIADGLTAHGFVIHALTRSEDTLILVDSLCRSGECPVVIIDLIMPKMDGSGVLGGLELLELLHNNFKDVPLMVISDYHHADAEKIVHDYGCNFVMKPRRCEIKSPDIIDSFLSRVVYDVRNYSALEDTGFLAKRFNLGDELRIEMGEADGTPHTVASAQPRDGLTLLSGMLEELNNPDLLDGVMLLVLRFASEFLNRAVLFTIAHDIISGFGQFGITGGAVSGDARIRSIHVRQGSGSLFDESQQAGTSRTFHPQPTQGDTLFFEQLGNGLPAEVFIGPLISQAKIIGFLYGDNLPEKTPISNVEPLTLFLAQAGMSVEKFLLERQLNERVTP
jgi:CheY-like chemotaxis protein